MYGLIGAFQAHDGKRDELIAILMGGGLSAMPGCFSYIVAKDSTDTNKLWITEVWDSQASHQASLTLQSVRDAITKARPLIAGMTRTAETEPLGGVGLP
jgi:quinol monooxygenase YgiN